MHTPLFTAACLLVFCVSLAACHAAPGSPENPAPGAWTDAVGAEWTLVELEGEPPIPGTTPTLTFSDDGRAVGHAGTNRFFGTFTSNAEGGLTLGALGSTRMHRSEPAGVMEQESRYLELLASVTRYRVADGSLSLYADRDEVLRFVKTAGDAAVGPAPVMP